MRSAYTEHTVVYTELYNSLLSVLYFLHTLVIENKVPFSNTVPDKMNTSD